jgi:hypothetical protein
LSQGLGRKPLAALGAATGYDIAATNRCHAAAEAMAAFANEFGRLVSALHNKSPYSLASSIKYLYFQIHNLAH